MSEARKVLGQTVLAATTLTDLYTVPAATQAVVSTIYVCNRGGSAVFRISVAVAGAVDDPSQYLYYNMPIPANETFAATVGITLGATDVIRGYASTANLTMTVFGVEVT